MGLEQSIFGGKVGKGHEACAVEQLFAYGTLQDPAVQKRVIGRLVKGIPDLLEGYERYDMRIDDEVYPVIAPSERGSVDGVVLTLTSNELKSVDVYEDTDYERRKVVLKSRKIVWAYLKPENHFPCSH